MNCAWNELLSIIPQRFRQQLDQLGKTDGQELRLRLEQPPMLVRKSDIVFLQGIINTDDLNYVVNMACRYSPWTAATASDGYVTAPGGHRIGMCGETLMKDGVMAGLKVLHSLNIRIARDLQGITRGLAETQGNILIVGPPGSGKTTLLRDIIRSFAKRETVCVVDERGELFPTGFHRGQRMDVLLGCPKPIGLDRVLRTMSPNTIAIDEITAVEDAQALQHAAWCGVRLLASCHAANQEDLMRRSVYQPIMESKLFSTLVLMQPDKSFRVERMKL